MVDTGVPLLEHGTPEKMTSSTDFLIPLWYIGDLLKFWLLASLAFQKLSNFFPIGLINSTAFSPL
jgi:hypothetical protein